jgi:cytosine/adenosine deaminase-related metal-dependent hydrolase
VGTDSYASNDELSILSELKVIAASAQQIPVEALLTWATKNGAEALNFHSLGSFEKGKKPGVILLNGVAKNGIDQQASVMRLV